MATYPLTFAQAAEIIGGRLSANNSKMPCKTHNISPLSCKTGSKLRAVTGSVCSKCYACKGKFCWDSVQLGLARRQAALDHALGGQPSDREAWVAAMVRLIGNDQWFRWHASGDLQSTTHLEMIMAVCERTPGTTHWLPTKELALVRQYAGAVPKNLTIRVSGLMIDGPPPKYACTSTVSWRKPAQGLACPAPKQDGACGPCRACWLRSVPNVDYHLH